MKQKDFLLILIPGFIITVLWVIFNIYHSHVTSTITDPLSIQIIPINGKFDTNTISKIKDRQKIEPLYEAQVSSGAVILTPTPAPSQLIDELSIETPIDETSTDQASLDISGTGE